MSRMGYGNAGNGLRRVLAAIALTVTGQAAAHHSPSAYDIARMVEAEGEVVEFQNINPHFKLKVKVAKPDGTIEIYDIHGAGKTLLKTTGVDLSEFKPGVKVKVAGYPRRTNDHELLVSNLLGPTAKEFLLGVPGALPTARWSQVSTGGYTAKDIQGVPDPVAAKRGIFRIWSGVVFIPDPEAMKKIAAGTAFMGGAKLTPEAEAIRKQNLAARLKMEAEGTQPDCAEQMSGIPTPFTETEFVDKGKTIEQRASFNKKPRVIYLQEPARKPAIDPAFGYSVGRWDGKTLVVRTTDLKGSTMGLVPQSDKQVLTERFTATDDGARLEYETVREDSVYLVEPTKTRAHWMWRPGANLEPYTCVETNTKARTASAGR